LEHRFVQEKFGDKPLETLDLNLELATSTIGADGAGVTVCTPAIIGRDSDVVFSTDVPDHEPLGEIAVNVFEESSNFVSGPSLAHGSLPGKVYPGIPISGGPVFGEQVS
jgi:hypothetical protein